MHLLLFASIKANLIVVNQSDLEKADKFRLFIEIEVIKILREISLKEGEQDQKIRDIARTVTDLIKPMMTLEELYQSAVKLDDKHPEMALLVFKIMKEYEERYERKALENVSQLVKSGRYDEAQNLVKKVLEFKTVN